MKKYDLLALAAGVFLLLGTARSQGTDTGKGVYEQLCRPCHAANGSGKTGTGAWMPIAASLKLERPEQMSLISEKAKNLSESDITKMIQSGGGKMMGLGGKVKKEEAEAVARYVVRTLQGRTK